LIKHIKIIETEMAKSAKKKVHVFKVNFDEIAFALRAAEQLKSWNVISDFKIISRSLYYELIIKER